MRSTFTCHCGTVASVALPEVPTPRCVRAGYACPGCGRRCSFDFRQSAPLREPQLAEPVHRRGQYAFCPKCETEHHGLVKCRPVKEAPCPS